MSEWAEREARLRQMADLLIRHGGDEDGTRVGGFLEEVFARLDQERAEWSAAELVLRQECDGALRDARCYREERDEARRQRDARPDCMMYSSVCEDRDNARAERDEAREALVGLMARLEARATSEDVTSDRQQAKQCNGPGSLDTWAFEKHEHAAAALREVAALADTSTLAAEVRAQHRAEALMEAADRIMAEWSVTPDDVSPEDWLRALADEERAK